MKISKDARRDARRLFRACFTNNLLDESKVRAAIEAVVRQKPRHYVAILGIFARLVRLEVARNTGHIESATELDTEKRASVEQRLQQFYRRPLALEFRVNPALIGGMRVTVGSDVWDGTVANRLAVLKAAA